MGNPVFAILFDEYLSILVFISSINLRIAHPNSIDAISDCTGLVSKLKMYCITWPVFNALHSNLEGEN